MGQLDLPTQCPQRRDAANAGAVDDVVGAAPAAVVASEQRVEGVVPRSTPRPLPDIDQALADGGVEELDGSGWPRPVASRPDEQQRALGMAGDHCLAAPVDRVPRFGPCEPLVRGRRRRVDVVGDDVHAEFGKDPRPVARSGAQLDDARRRPGGDAVRRLTGGNGEDERAITTSRSPCRRWPRVARHSDSRGLAP